MASPFASESFYISLHSLGTALERRRPTGVTIIAVLAIIEGIFLLAVGIIDLVALAPFIGQVNENALFALGGVIAILGVYIALGIAEFVVAWGLLKGKGWAWIVTIIINIISAVLNIISIAAGGIENIGGLIINGIIIYYLYRPNVKAYFGRVRATTV
jgi:hypothetical protein